MQQKRNFPQVTTHTAHCWGQSINLFYTIHSLDYGHQLVHEKLRNLTLSGLDLPSIDYGGVGLERGLEAAKS